MSHAISLQQEQKRDNERERERCGDGEVQRGIYSEISCVSKLYYVYHNGRIKLTFKQNAIW